LRSSPKAGAGKPVKTTPPPIITVAASAKGWRIVSQWTPEPAVYDDPADILCALLADLVLAYVEADPHLLCLHAGAVALGSPGAAGSPAPLFVFPAESQAGKSTLTAALAASGGRLYSDDVLPIDLSSPVASAVAPACRCPMRCRHICAKACCAASLQPMRATAMSRWRAGNWRRSASAVRSPPSFGSNAPPAMPR
jgi:hypothetical protein